MNRYMKYDFCCYHLVLLFVVFFFISLTSWKENKKWIKHCFPVRDLKYLLVQQGPKVWYMANSDISEKAMAPHSSTLAWKIPWTEEPGGLQSMGSLRVWHDWVTSLSLFTFMRWRRKCNPLVFLPGESQGLGSLVGCCLWGCTESDTTEAT